MYSDESVKHFTAAERTLKKFNIYGEIPRVLDEEWTDELLRSDAMRIERIVSRGHRSPDDFWYEQSENEWVLVIAGRARLLFEGESSETELEVGDCLTIPARARHKVTWTSPEQDTIWVAIFYS